VGQRRIHQLKQKALVDHISCQRALGLSQRGIHALNCEIEFILMVLWIVAVRGNPIQFHVLGIEERQDRVVEQVGGRDRVLRS
jgi:hypothetical protein